MKLKRHGARPALPLLLAAATLLMHLPTMAGAATLALSGPPAPGSAVLVTVADAPAGATFSGVLDGEPFPITPAGRAIIAWDMDAKPGPSRLRVTVTAPGGAAETLSETLTLPPRAYKVERIDGLPGKKVELNPQDLARARKEGAAIRASYESRGGQPDYTGGFRQPVTGRFSGVFGSRRILNGKPRSPHNGVDIAAPKGTPVAATAPGEVVLVGQEYFFTGNTVVIHHGDGVISLYSHLDSATVAPGQRVARDQVIGHVGMSGRATGPHLHWGARVRGNRVDPMRLPGVAEWAAEAADTPGQGAER